MFLKARGSEILPSLQISRLIKGYVVAFTQSPNCSVAVQKRDNKGRLMEIWRNVNKHIKHGAENKYLSNKHLLRKQIIQKRGKTRDFDFSTDGI